ncbi:MAG: NUDIX hydrolase [Zoogloeaceae bacterium]|nr:NUDIX hydrolase [Zoogloeaceae bacterium]
MRFCNQCGKTVEYRIPEGESLPRAVCGGCGYIQYENPRLILGAVAEWEGRLLLCRRAIEPRAGLWTLPAGFMENGESSLDAALRETREEARAELLEARLFALMDVPGVNQVHVFYRARLADGRHAPGEESLETMLAAEAEIPWSALAFRTTRRCLELYLEDRRRGVFQTHQITLDGRPCAA